jgi:hypothetical protein
VTADALARAQKWISDPAAPFGPTLISQGAMNKSLQQHHLSNFQAEWFT